MVDNNNGEQILERAINNLLLTISSKADGYSCIQQLLIDFYEDYNIDGKLLAKRFNYNSFESFLRSNRMKNFITLSIDAQGKTVYKAKHDGRISHIVEQQIISAQSRTRKNEQVSDRFTSEKIHAGTIGRKIYKNEEYNCPSENVKAKNNLSQGFIGNEANDRITNNFRNKDLSQFHNMNDGRYVQPKLNNVGLPELGNENFHVKVRQNDNSDFNEDENFGFKSFRGNNNFSNFRRSDFNGSRSESFSASDNQSTNYNVSLQSQSNFMPYSSSRRNFNKEEENDLEHQRANNCFYNENGSSNREKTRFKDNQDFNEVFDNNSDSKFQRYQQYAALKSTNAESEKLKSQRFSFSDDPLNSFDTVPQNDLPKITVPKKINPTKMAWCDDALDDLDNVPEDDIFVTKTTKKSNVLRKRCDSDENFSDNEKKTIYNKEIKTKSDSKNQAVKWTKKAPDGQFTDTEPSDDSMTTELYKMSSTVGEKDHKSKNSITHSDSDTSINKEMSLTNSVNKKSSMFNKINSDTRVPVSHGDKWLIESEKQKNARGCRNTSAEKNKSENLKNLKSSESNATNNYKSAILPASSLHRSESISSLASTITTRRSIRNFIESDFDKIIKLMETVVQYNSPRAVLLDDLLAIMELIEPRFSKIEQLSGLKAPEFISQNCKNIEIFGRPGKQNLVWLDDE